MAKQDLIVLGGGVAGLVTTSVAAQLGLKVTLIEKRKQLGGDCLHYGCVPSKTFIHAAKVASLMQRATAFGLDAVTPKVDLAKVNAKVQEVIAQIQPHDDPERFRSYGAEVLFGEAKFINANEIILNDEHLSAKRFLIATGSSPAVPPIPGLAAAGFITNETVFQQQQLPQKLIILGAGVIGIELAQAFARLGSDVSVVELADRILPMIDAEVATQLQTHLALAGIKLYLNSKVTAVKSHGDQKIIECTPTHGEKFFLTTDEILVATGRKANVDDLDLSQAQVKYTARGIQVDARLRTSNKRIFAAGDVTDGPYKFTHMAEYQAGIVISNALFRFPKKTNYRVAPAVIFTDPEIATVGLTFTQAQAKYPNARELQFDFKDIDRALAEREPLGVSKLVIHKEKILGATLMGPHAGELIAEIVLAMQSNLKISQISAAIHAYPTLAQINRRVVNTFYGEKLFNPRVKRLVGWINRWL